MYMPAKPSPQSRWWTRPSPPILVPLYNLSLLSLLVIPPQATIDLLCDTINKFAFSGVLYKWNYNMYFFIQLNSLKETNIHVFKNCIVLKSLVLFLFISIISFYFSENSLGPKFSKLSSKFPRFPDNCRALFFGYIIWLPLPCSSFLTFSDFEMQLY